MAALETSLAMLRVGPFGNHCEVRRLGCMEALFPTPDSVPCQAADIYILSAKVHSNWTQVAFCQCLNIYGFAYPHGVVNCL